MDHLSKSPTQKWARISLALFLSGLGSLFLFGTDGLGFWLTAGRGRVGSVRVRFTGLDDLVPAQLDEPRGSRGSGGDAERC